MDDSAKAMMILFIFLGFSSCEAISRIEKNKTERLAMQYDCSEKVKDNKE